MRACVLVLCLCYDAYGDTFVCRDVVTIFAQTWVTSQTTCSIGYRDKSNPETFYLCLSGTSSRHFHVHSCYASIWHPADWRTRSDWKLTGHHPSHFLHSLGLFCVNDVVCSWPTERKTKEFVSIEKVHCGKVSEFLPIDF